MYYNMLMSGWARKEREINRTSCAAVNACTHHEKNACKLIKSAYYCIMLVPIGLLYILCITCAAVYRIGISSLRYPSWDIKTSPRVILNEMYGTYIRAILYRYEFIIIILSCCILYTGRYIYIYIWYRSARGEERSTLRGK